MKCAVYLSRCKGDKLARPAGPVLGVLQVMPFHDGSHSKPILRAELWDTNGRPLLPVLFHVRVGRVQGTWLSVSGTEHVPRRGGTKSLMDHYRQTWWCLVESDWPAVGPMASLVQSSEPDSPR